MESTPTPDRPVLPDGYGVPETTDGLLRWDQVEPRLREAQHYWISSVRPDHRPHSVPRWGVWLDGRFWYDGAPTTRHTRNVETNPAVTLTLESGTEVVIVEGESHATRAEPHDLGARLAEAFGKYAASGYSPAPDFWAGEDGGGLRVVIPLCVLAWFDFPHDCTRFTFGDGTAPSTARAQGVARSSMSWRTMTSSRPGPTPTTEIRAPISSSSRST